jgi:uncharacterized protein YjiS (DUF1127 family)
MTSDMTSLPGAASRWPAAPRRAGAWRRLSPPRLAALIYWIERQMEKQRSRRALLGLNDDQLRDIGLSRCDACREASRRFWE